MTNWFKRLFGGSGESSPSDVAEPATASEPAATPAEPAAAPETSDESASDAGDEPA